MRRILSLILAVVLLLSCVPAALATDNSREFFFELSVDGGDTKQVQPGDVMVAGWNFGCGSSREHAPLVIKTCGTGCVIAKSFARIFYRNAINIGLPILECQAAAEEIQPGDAVSVNFDTGVITDITTGKTYQAEPFPDFIQNIIQAGGLLASLKEG